MATLGEIAAEYKLDEQLYNKLVKTLKYDYSKKKKDVLQFMEELPHKVKLELAVVVHRKMYSSVNFFDNKDQSFIAWIGSVIRPINIQELEYVFQEREDILEVFFLVNGEVSYVLPRFKNYAFKIIEKGEHFGHVDLFGIHKITDTLIAPFHSKKRNT